MNKSSNNSFLSVGELFWKNNQLEDLPNEKWVDACGFDGYYEVSNLGRIKSLGRWVNNGKSQRWVKEKIRKQVLVGDGRLTCHFSVENIAYSINVSELIYQSFFPEKSWNKSRYCVMHKNKLKCDNRITNLKLSTITDSHKLNAKKGLLPHLYENNKRRTDEYNKLTHKICSVCGVKKTIENYEHGRNKCMDCRNIEKYELYESKLKKKGKERKNNTIIIITDTITGEKHISTNKNKCIISKLLVNRYANTGEYVYPYRNSNHKNPLLVEIKKVGKKLLLRQIHTNIH